MQSLPPSSSLLGFKEATYVSHRAMYTMILPLEFAALISGLSGKFVLSESRRLAHIVCVVEDRAQQHASLALYALLKTGPNSTRLSPKL